MGNKLCDCNNFLQNQNKYETNMVFFIFIYIYINWNSKKQLSSNTKDNITLVDKINSLSSKERLKIINKINKISNAYRNHLTLKTVKNKIIIIKYRKHQHKEHLQNKMIQYHMIIHQ